MSSTTSFVPKLFLAGAFLGAIGCLSRADYNLPIFLFAYIAWNYLRNQQLYIMILFVFSLIVDIIWFFLIARGTWGSVEYKRLAPWETGIHNWVTWVTVINFILKIICAVLSWLYEPAIKQGIKGFSGNRQ